MATDQPKQRFGIILAGGSGERFWPLSRRNKPKQLLHLTHPDKSMLADAAHRAADVIPLERIFIVTGEHLVAPIQELKIGIPDGKVIAEPDKRNTAGALAYATAVILARYPDLDAKDISLAVLTADHLITDLECFHRTLNAAMTAAENEEALTTCGIQPTEPETGFGYIQADEKGEGSSIIDGVSVFPVRAFHEKPNRQRAEDFINSGDYYWNSGMFFWTASTFLRELELSQPAIARTVLDMRQALLQNDTEQVNEIFRSLENISIDYALMEHARKVLVVKGTFLWIDVGSLPALTDLHDADENGNCLIGESVLHDVEDSLVYNDLGPDRMAVGVLGVRDIAVIVTEDGVLVIPKDRAQDVRHIVKQLKDRGADQV